MRVGVLSAVVWRKVGMMADIAIEGKILRLDNLAIPSINLNCSPSELGEMLALRHQLIPEARSLGIEQTPTIRLRG